MRKQTVCSFRINILSELYTEGISCLQTFTIFVWCELHRSQFFPWWFSAFPGAPCQSSSPGDAGSSAQRLVMSRSGCYIFDRRVYIFPQAGLRKLRSQQSFFLDWPIGSNWLHWIKDYQISTVIQSRRCWDECSGEIARSKFLRGNSAETFQGTEIASTVDFILF